MGHNRTAGVALLFAGAGWVAVWPGFLWWMVSMEGRGGPDRPDEAAWRLWRALEILLVEPRLIANTLAVLILAASVLGFVLLAVGIAILSGNPRAPKWAAVAIVSGISYCLIGFVFHWALLMPTVSVAENREVVRASGDLNLAIPVALGAGLVSMIVVGAVLLGGWRQEALAENLDLPQ
jgi:hypothetical protein